MHVVAESAEGGACALQTGSRTLFALSGCLVEIQSHIFATSQTPTCGWVTLFAEGQITSRTLSIFEEVPFYTFLAAPISGTLLADH